MISVIIPYYNKHELTIACVDSFIKFNTDVKYEILLIDNNSNTETIDKIYAKYKDNKNIKLLSYPYPFNYHKINNWGVELSKGDFIYLLNNDTEFVEESQGLLNKMTTLAKDNNIGAVGSLMLFENRTHIQHAGVYLKAGGYADHIFFNIDIRYFDQYKIEDQYNYKKDRLISAVTAAGVLIERKKFYEVGCLSEEFIVCGGDVDLCIKLQLMGYKTMYVGTHYIIHKESQTRKGDNIPITDFINSYDSYIKIFDPVIGDPYTPLTITNIQ